MEEIVEAQRADKGNHVIKRIVWIILAIFALLIVAGVAAKGVLAILDRASVKTKQYQAVFLTNGQVYFGKMVDGESKYIKLTNVYYLQVQQDVQQSKTTTGTSAGSNASTQQVSLAKLGGELHGPEDSMYIARDQMLFWENIKDSGKVAKAIKDYVAQGNK